MNKNWSGLFSLGLQSVEWQVKNLFQDVGGSKVIELMDCLAGIPDAQREKLLESFISQAAKNSASRTYSINSTESALKKLEDQIVNDVVADINKSKFSVVYGGKSSAHTGAKLLDFATARRERESLNN